MALDARAVSRATPIVPLLRHVILLHDGHCRLIMLVFKGRCAHDPLYYTFNIDVIKSGKTNTSRPKHFCNESANLIGNFDSNN